MPLCAFAVACLAAAMAGPPEVRLQRVPDGGIQPQALSAPDGTLHLLYYKGDPKAGDLFYTRRPAGQADLASSIRVNSQPGSAIAIGNDRGGQIALGAAGRIHVAWNGSSQALPKAPPNPAMPKDSPYSGTPMLYARLDDSGRSFEPQRNLITRSTALDGGGSVAATGDLVFVAWHAAPLAPERPTPTGEAFRRVFIARSQDGGATFEPEAPVSPEDLGACGCCGLKAFIDESGALGILFRSAQRSVNRDMYWLRREPGDRFAAMRLDPWALNACPMTTSAAAAGEAIVVMAWETADQVRFAARRAGAPSVNPISAPGKADRRKYPAIAINLRGEVLLAWTEGMSWSQGGSLHWQVYTAGLEPIAAAAGQRDGVPPWSLIAAAAEPDGSFTVIY